MSSEVQGRGFRTWLVAIAALCALAAATAPTALASGGQAKSPNAPNPLVGQKWWDQNTEYNLTWSVYRGLRARGKTRDANDIKLLAEQPQFRWWGRYEKPLVSKIRGSFQTMDRQEPGQVPLMAVFFHEGRGCSPSYQGGGPAEDRRYKGYIRQFARAVGSREVVLAFEPDATGTTKCLAKSRRRARLRTLAYGVRVLSRLPNATVYIDATASDWQGVPTVARKLRALGVRRVRGFMLNATHQDTTRNNIRYGARLSRAVGGKHFIINTSHNGNGNFRRSGKVYTCNPPNVAAGARPTTNTDHPKVDAYMWVERPGYSNGACGGGPARVGAFWLKRALQMVRGADWYR